MGWACVLFAAALGLASAAWLRTRRYRYADDVVLRTLSPWWLPAAAVFATLVGTPFYAGVPAPVAIVYVLALVWAFTLAFIDLEVRRLPNVLTLPAYPVAAVLLTLASLSTGNWAALARAATCAGIAVAGFTVVLAVSLVLSPDGTGFGWGDVKLSGGLAGLLGWFSWVNACYGLLTGCAIGGVAAAALLLSRRGSRKTHLSYGPSLVAGAYLWALLLPG